MENFWMMVMIDRVAAYVYLDRAKFILEVKVHT